MTDQPSPAEDASGLDRAKLSKEFKDLVTPANILLVIILAGLALIGLFGGWNNLADSKKAVPTVALEKSFQAAPLRVKVRKMLWFDNVPQIYQLRPGQRALVVSAVIVNESDRYVTAVDLDKVFRLEGLQLIDDLTGKPIAADKAEPMIFRASDSFDLRSLQPDVAASVALVWLQDSKLPLPKTMTVQVNKQRYRRSALDGSMGYFDPAPAYEISGPLTKLTAP